MNTFIKFLSKNRHMPLNYGYSALRLDPTTATKLSSSLSKLGINSIAQLFHCTLIYDVTNPIPPEYMISINKPLLNYNFTVKGVTVLGNAVVLLIESPEIIDRCKELSTVMTHAYGDFLLHISLVYSDDQKYLNRIKSKIINNYDDILKVMTNGTLGQEYFENLT